MVRIDVEVIGYCREIDFIVSSWRRQGAKVLWAVQAFDLPPPRLTGSRQVCAQCYYI